MNGWCRPRSGMEGRHMALQVMLSAESTSAIYLAADEALDALGVVNVLMGLEVIGTLES